MNVGHSFMFASNSMEILKAVNTPKTQTWSWIQPQFCTFVSFKIIENDILQFLSICNKIMYISRC